MFDFSSLVNFHFIRPYWLLVFIAGLWALRQFSQRDDTIATWRHVMSPQILKHLTVAGNEKRWLSPHRLSIVLLALTTLVLMGPTWRQQVSPFSEDKSALIIALDLSSSMSQSDVQPSRLLRAKQKVIELMALRGDANTALIAYSGSAHVVMPITNDREMIRHFLDALDEQVMPQQGKAPQAILPLVKELLAPLNVTSTVLLISDGCTELTQQAFGRFFEENKYQFIAWAIGREITSEAEQGIPLQFDQLKALAEHSDGKAVMMTDDTSDVNLIVRYIKRNLMIVDDESKPWFDSGYILLFFVAALFLLWFRKGWTLEW